jgi:BolA protein
VHIVSPAFAGKRLLERHKMVNAALAPLMGSIHALSIRKAKTPEEDAAAQQQQAAAT